MEYYTDGLNTAIESIIGKKEEDKIEKAKQEAYNKIVETQINSLHKKSKLTTPTIEKNIESKQQLSLF